MVPPPHGSPSATAAAPSFVGPHEVRLEGDLLCVRFVGPYLPDEARQILTLGDQLYRQHGGCYMLADARLGHAPGPETRRVIAMWPYLGTYVAAVHGAGTGLRALTTLMVGAQRLLRVRQPIRTELFEGEAEARAWLLEQRRLLRGS